MELYGGNKWDGDTLTTTSKLVSVFWTVHWQNINDLCAWIVLSPNIVEMILLHIRFKNWYLKGKSHL